MRLNLTSVPALMLTLTLNVLEFLVTRNLNVYARKTYVFIKYIRLPHFQQSSSLSSSLGMCVYFFRFIFFFDISYVRFVLNFPVRSWQINFNAPHFKMIFVAYMTNLEIKAVSGKTTLKVISWEAEGSRFATEDETWVRLYRYFMSELIFTE